MTQWLSGFCLKAHPDKGGDTEARASHVYENRVTVSEDKFLGSNQTCLSNFEFASPAQKLEIAASSI